MKVLITGGTGFIGRYVLELLSGRRYALRCLVRRTSDTTAVRRSRAEFVVGDVTDRESVRRAMAGCDAVVHLANLYDFWPSHVKEFREVNVDGTRNVMEAAVEARVSKVVHVSSLVVYTAPADGPVTEDSPQGTRFPSRYSRTKHEGEQIAWELHRTRGLPLVVVYPGVVVGAGDDKASAGYIAAVVGRAMPAEVLPRSGFNFVHVRDVAEIVVRALEKEGNVGQRYFAASDWLSFRDFNRLIAEASGVPLPRLSMPTPMLLACSAVLTFLGRLFGFAPMLGMSLDQIRTMKQGARVDGSKATRTLGVTYRSLAAAVREDVDDILRRQGSRDAVDTDLNGRQGGATAHG